jgi:hypothetical protein
MWLIFILAGLCIIIFNYSIQKRRERREDRQKNLRELRQKQLDLLLKKNKESTDDKKKEIPFKQFS